MAEKTLTNAESVLSRDSKNKTNDALIAYADHATSKPDDSNGHIAVVRALTAADRSQP